MKTIEEIAEMLEAAEQAWDSGEHGDAYFMCRLANVYAQLAQLEIVGSAVNEHNQVMVKATTLTDDWAA